MYSSRKVVYPRSRKTKEKKMKKFILILSVAVSVLAIVDVVNAGCLGFAPRPKLVNLLIKKGGQ
jgi:hypothetical protein